VKRAAFLLAWALLSSAPLLACKDPKAAEPKKAPALTDEEREIMKDRELLENLELLQSLEKFWYFDLFSEEDPQKDKNPAEPAAKKDERKK
jgi:hypothetical protein